MREWAIAILNLLKNVVVCDRSSTFIDITVAPAKKDRVLILGHLIYLHEIIADLSCF